MSRNSTPIDRPTTPARRPAGYWLGLLLLLTCSQLRAQAPADIARLNQQAAPLAALQAGSGFTDLAPLAAVVAPARVVGLGECTHGTHEVFQLKHRLLEYLVTQQGITTLALEVDYGWGEILNEYIQTGAGDSLTVHKAAGFAIWDTTEFWDMVEWMRTYNQQHATKIRYVGIDMQDVRPNLLRLENFATQRADTALRRQVQQLRTAYAAPNQTSADARQRLVRLADELVQHLQAVAAPAAMQQHGQVLRQRAEPLTDLQRDQMMATNVAWLLKQEPAAKVVLWAHNIHIRRDDYQPRMGQYLARQLGPAYVAVGFATGHGTASVFNSDGTSNALVLAPPVPNSFEMWLDQAALPNYLLNLHTAATTSKWLTKNRKFRQIGATEPGSMNGQFMWYAPLTNAFDALIYLHDTSASQPYRAAHPAR